MAECLFSNFNSFKIDEDFQLSRLGTLRFDCEYIIEVDPQGVLWWNYDLLSNNLSHS